MTLLALFANTYTTTSTSSDNTGAVLLSIAVALVYIMAMWRIFDKAKKPGWAAIIPIYNLYIMLKVVGRPGWWILLYLVPIVNIVIHLIVSIDLAKAFGKSTTFGVVGIWIFSCIGYLILGYGDARYKKPKYV